MKKIIYICILFIFFGCTKNLENLNVDVKNATSAPAETFFNLALKNMSDRQSGLNYGANGSPFNLSRIWAQQISSVTYNEGSTYYSNFDWANIYLGVLNNLQQSAVVIENSETPTTPSDNIALQNQRSIIEVMKVYTYSKLVESFGNIPYTEALDVNNISPAYDDAETIYIDLLSRLNTALDNMDASGPGWGHDLMYDGNMALWKKFGKSLQLQMGMRIVDSNPQLASDNIIAALPGIFTSNGDNGQIKHLNAQPNTSELWVNLAVGNRKDFVGAKPFVDYMNELEDPRRNVYFKSVDGEFAGSPSGRVVPYDEYSEFGELFYEPTTPVIFLDYATVKFLLAEAAERNIGGVTDAESHYNEAIQASFEYYGVEGAETYLQQPAVAYSTAPGNWKQKIGMQKWVALFNQGLEAWTEFRRLDYPQLAAPEGAYVNTVPVRLIYPISEQTLNRSNFEAAAAAIGGDVLTTKLFWDVQ